MRAWTHRLEGIVLLFTAIALLFGLFGHHIPDTFQGLGVLSRMLDNFRPHLLGLALCGAAVLAISRMPKTALLIAVASIFGGLWMVLDHRQRIAPPLQSVSHQMEVLWFNVLKDNPITPDQLSTALQSSNAAVIVLAEAAPAFAALPALAQAYPFREGCVAQDQCELLILSQHPLGPITFETTAFGPQRLARFQVRPPNQNPVTVVAAHRIKPWYLGLTETGDDWMNAVLSGDRNTPLIVMGDFNATPWSRQLTHLTQVHGLQTYPRPLSTWPAQAGPFGLAIDHILTRGPASITGLSTWGHDLGSNHLGLRATISIGP